MDPELVDYLDRRFAGLHHDFDGRFAQIDGRFAQIEARLDEFREELRWEFRDELRRSIGLAGNLVRSAVVSTVTTTGSELSWATVEADGQQLAKNVATSLGQLFASQGWIPPGAIK